MYKKAFGFVISAIKVLVIRNERYDIAGTYIPWFGRQAIS
jgi:hypothetical protein